MLRPSGAFERIDEEAVLQHFKTIVGGHRNEFAKFPQAKDSAERIKWPDWSWYGNNQMFNAMDTVQLQHPAQYPWHD